VSAEVRIAVGLALWGVPLGIAAFVPGASGVLIYLLVVSCLGVLLFGQGTLSRKRKLQVPGESQFTTGDIKAKNVSVNQSGGTTGDVEK